MVFLFSSSHLSLNSSGKILERKFFAFLPLRVVGFSRAILKFSYPSFKNAKSFALEIALKNPF